MTVYFTFTLPPETFQTPEQVIAIANPLIPSPQPADLRIEADPTIGVTISYSHDFPTALAAAQGIVKAMKVEVPI